MSVCGSPAASAVQGSLGSQALPPAAKPCPLQGLGSVACYPNVPVSRELLKVQNSSKENVGLAFSSHLTHCPLSRTLALGVSLCR